MDCKAHARRIAAAMGNSVALAALFGATSLPAAAQFTARAAPEPLVRQLRIVANNPVPGTTSLWATSFGGGMSKGTDDGTTISWVPMATSLPTTRLYSTLFLSDTTFYTATDGFGIQKTIDGGVTFADANGWAGLSPLGCSRVRNVTLFDGDLYAGTACPYDSGVWKSTDDGLTWMRLGVGTIPDDSVINTIVINSVGTLMLVATSRNGIFRSTDLGATFTPANSGIPNSPLLSAPDAFNIQCGPGCSTLLLANIQGVGVYKSVDGGQTWANSSTGLPSNPPMASGMTRDSTTTPFTYFVSVDGAGVYASTDEGASWQGWGNTDYFSTVKFVRGVVRDGSVAGKYYVNKFDGVARTFDSGANDWYTSPVGRGTYNSIVHTIAGHTYATNATLLSIPNITAPLPYASDFGIQGLMTLGAVYQAPGQPDTLYSTTNNYGAFKSTDLGSSWAPASGGLPTTINQAPRLGFDPVSPGVMYLISTGSPGIGVYRSTDGGANWTERNTGLPPEARSGNRILVDRATPTTLYAATDAGLYKSTDSGASWSIAYFVDYLGLPLAVNQVVQSTLDANVLYIATNHNTAIGAILPSSGVLKSVDGGANWSVVLQGRVENLRILNGDVIFAGLADGPGQAPIKRSNDGGATWANPSAGISGYDVRTFGVSEDRGAVVSVALEDGFYTADGVREVIFVPGVGPEVFIHPESIGSITQGVTRFPSSPGVAFTVQYETTTQGTATPGVDFTAVSGTLNFAASDQVKFFQIPVVNDSLTEGPETLYVRLFNPSNATGTVKIGHPALSNIALTLVEGSAQIGFASTTASVGETGGNINVTVTRVGPTTATQTVTYTTANGTALAGTDFGTTTAQVSGAITFAPGETTKTIAIGATAVAAPYVRIINDTVLEPPETFTISLSAPTNGALVGPVNFVTVTITSDENQVSMVSATASFAEGSGAQQVMVNRTGTVGPFSVNYVFANGTAVNGTHYAGTNGTLSWASGETGAKGIPVTINDAPGVNANRTFTVSLTSVTGISASYAAPTSTTVTITNDDQTVQFSTAATVTVTEGISGYTFQVTRLGSAVGQSASVTWEAVDGTALNGSDYGAAGVTTPLTGTLSWAAGDSSTKLFNIPIISDTTPEVTKAFTVRLVSPIGPNLALGTNSQVTVNINDNDRGVAFAAATYEATEGGPGVVVAVRRIGPSTAALSATWATVNGSAESGKDFGILNNLAPRTGTVSWTAGDVANKTFTIPIINDTLGGEGDETFTITLTPGAGAVLATPGTAVVTIHDNDIPPQTNVRFTAPKYIVSENGGTAVLTVQRVDLGPGFGMGAAVQYATQPGTALATSDYTAKSGAVTWLPGDGTDKQITIAIVNNSIAEPIEGFKVVLSSPSAGVGLGTPSEITVTISDDDEVFPPDGGMPGGFSQPAGVTKGWHVANDPGAYEGAFTLKSDEVDDGETAGLEMSGTFAAGNVSFRVKISSEPGFDVLAFYVDGVAQPLTWSGTTVTGWTLSPTYPLTAGVHTLRWVYSKDGSASFGMDAAHIDALVTPAFTP